MCEMYQRPDFGAWLKNDHGLRIADENVNFLVAPEVLRKPNGSTLFTYDEVRKITKTLPDGWQLPDSVIASIMVSALGKERGFLCGKKLIESLGVPLDGYAWPNTNCQVSVESNKIAVCWLSDSNKETVTSSTDIHYHRTLEATRHSIKLCTTDDNPLGFPSREETSGCMILLVHVTTKRY